MPLQAGTEAPNFTLKTKTSEGLQEVSLSAHQGQSQVVLLFFPFAFTSVCMDEMCYMRDNLGDFTDLEARVYGISGDSPFTQEIMAQKENIPFPLLSDYNHEVAMAYGVAYDDLLGYKDVAKRSAFVIGKDGIVKYTWCSDDPKQLPPFDEVKAALGQ